MNNLLYWLTTPTEKVFEDYKQYVINDNIMKHHIFIDMDAPVLYVAHVDTVRNLLLPEEILYHDNIINATGLDDRLGIYIAFKLNALGYKGDILLTDHEEIGFSTAKFFKTKKKYKWVCEFDRAGEDFVTYGDDSKEFIKTLKEFDMEQGKGSYSDITVLNLPDNPCMFNLGIGYQLAHSIDSFCDVTVMLRSLKRFMKFYKEYSNTHYEVEYPDFSFYKDNVQRELDLSYNECILDVNQMDLIECTSCDSLLFTHEIEFNICPICNNHTRYSK